MERSGSASSIRVVPASPGVGKYRFIASLDDGGMADVYLAVTKDTGFEKIVVIKQLRDELADDPSFVAMFMDEARLAARLNHPNVVQTYEVGSDEGVHFIAMEFLEGVPYVRLARLKERLPPPLALHVRILVETLRGLHYAHELCDFDGRPLNVVHRDMSPQNVMLTFEGGVKVLDFGIAKAALSAEKRPEDFKGKLEYMAPEQALLEDVDRRADIYSVGIMLWEAITRGRFYTKGEDKLLRLTEGAPPDVLEMAPNAPKRIAAICRRALARDRNLRFATAEQMADELEEWLVGTGQHVTARDVGSYVAEKFEERRNKLSRAIRAQLERFRSLGDQGAFSIRPVAPIHTDFPPPPSSGASRPPQMTLPLIPPHVPPIAPSGFPMVATQPTRKGSSATLVAIVTVVLAAVVLGAVVFVARTKRAPAAQAAQATASTPATAAPPPPPPASVAPVASEIDFTIKASPPNATIFIDGQRTDTNPATGTRPRDGAVHVVRVEATGFEPREESVSFDRSLLVTIELRPAVGEPSARPTKPPSWRGKPAPRPGMSKGGAPGGNLDTENPYQ